MLVRCLMVAVLGLALTGGPALAATRDEAAAGQRTGTAAARAMPSQPKARAPARAAASGGRTVRGGQRRAAGPGASQGAIHRPAPVSGEFAVSRDWRTATATTSCVRNRGVTRCRGQSLTWSEGGGIGGWTRGLAPAANVQANECPAGTMATLARGHDDVVRCMPI